MGRGRTWSAPHDGAECNAIDPGAFLDPTDGRLWLTYGSYIGYIRLVELDPKTGKRLHADEKPLNIAINCEATDMIYHDGWYYLFATHGTCCIRAASTYNIRMGRARKVTGPFLDNMGIDMLKGGGKLFCGSGGRVIGPGHFGLLDCGDGVQKFSCHYEADLDKGGISVLDIRPLQWRNGWPVAGENLKGGKYEIESAGPAPRWKWGWKPWSWAAEKWASEAPVAEERADAAPAAGLAPAAGRALAAAERPHVAESAGERVVAASSARPFPRRMPRRWTPIGPPATSTCGCSRICCRRSRSGPSRRRPTPAVIRRRTSKSRSREPAALWPPPTTANSSCCPPSPASRSSCGGSSSFSDGTYRIMTKPGPKTKEPLAISALGSSSATLGKFNPDSDKQRWLLKSP